MQINREWERTVASNWSGFIGALSVSKSISFGHLLWLRFSLSPPLPPFSLLTVHLSFSLSRFMFRPASLPPSFNFYRTSSRFLLTIRPCSSVKYTTYVHVYTLICCTTFADAYIRQGPVINQELVPSAHFIRVVEMRTNDSKNIAATVMRQSFGSTLCKCARLPRNRKEQTDPWDTYLVRAKFLTSPSLSIPSS